MKKLYLCLDSYVGLYSTDLWEHDDSRLSFLGQIWLFEDVVLVSLCIYCHWKDVVKSMAAVLASKFKQLYVSPKFREFVRFAIVGLIATGIHYGIYYLLNLFINVNVAYTIGYLVSWFVNLYLTAHFTFKSTLSFKKGAGFAVSHLINYLLHMLFLNLFLVVGVSEEIAPLFVFAVVIPINFLLVRFVFKSKQFKSQEE